MLHYCPTYQSLTDPELRGILFLADEATQGRCSKNVSVLRISLYELLNQIGVTDPVDGYQKLKNFQSVYGGLDGAFSRI